MSREAEGSKLFLYTSTALLTCRRIGWEGLRPTWLAGLTILSRAMVQLQARWASKPLMASMLISVWVLAKLESKLAIQPFVPKPKPRKVYHCKSANRSVYKE